jgi:WD40 repeat protein
VAEFWNPTVPSGNYLAVYSNSAMWVWDLRCHPPAITIKLSRSLAAVAWSPDGSYLTTLRPDGELLLHNPDGGELSRIRVTQGSDITCGAENNIFVAGYGGIAALRQLRHRVS